MRSARLAGSVLTVLLAGAWAHPAHAQRPFPLAPIFGSGQTVTPVFEGWYENPDGSYTLSFGYHNRNADEVLEIPVGPENFVDYGDSRDHGQPTRFEPRRHWGVFGVRVPADFDRNRKVYWTLEVRGETLSVPGSLARDWKIDALEGEAGSGNTPPVLRLEPGDVRAQGPGGAVAGPLRTRAGEPLTLTVHASDDGRPSTSVASSGREDVPVSLTWFEHRGPGAVTFDEPETEVDVAGGTATTAATFDAPGQYVLRVRANDASGVAGAGHAQCCWTNGFVTVEVTGTAVAAEGAHDGVTYARDVAPILQQKCQVCHQPNSVAPMSLLTYEQAEMFAPLIRYRVANRIMPPWHINPTVGIQDFQNDRGLSPEQIETIVRWVDLGAPFGDSADLPPPKDFPDPNRWQLSDRFGEPDLIVKSEPYTLEAHTQDKWFRPVVETGLTEARWVRAIEVKPSYPDGRRIVHHVLTFLEQEEDGVTGLAAAARDDQRSAGLFMEWAVGKVGEIFPPDAGKLMLPGSKIRWEVHMHAVGERIEDNQVELGVWFYPKGERPKYRTVLEFFDARGPSSLDIPPGEVAMTQGFHVLPAPARLENFQPHMHMRGKAMSMEAILPDGERRLLSVVDRFQWRWHVNYVYDEDAAPLLPEGTVLAITAWHDNTASHPSNPDPEQWVGWGDRTVDDMAHAWVDVTYLDQDYYEELVAQREGRAAEDDRVGNR